MPQQQHNNSSSEAARLIEEWRADVNQQLDDISRSIQQSNIILERLTNRHEEFDRRLRLLEQAPEQRERTVIGLGGLVGNAIYIGLLTVSILLSLTSHVSFH